MTISVVVCAKNEEKYIKKCLQCLKRQTLKPEIIVVDGHSIDDTYNIAKKYADKVVRDKKNGIASARNLGWKTAKGEIVAYCDADCRPPDDWIEKISKLMKDNVCIFGPIIPYDAKTEARIGLKVWGDLFLRIVSKMDYPCICASNAAFKRDILKKHPFRLNFLEDFDLGNRLRKVGKVKCCKELYMLISARRFKKGFHRTAFKYYLLNYFRLKIGKEQKMYW
ncbi:MAG: glycosyltransferase [Candidatus Aenigmatarchaeota archaeon]